MLDDEDEVYSMINTLVNSHEVQPKKFYVAPPMNMDIRLGTVLLRARRPRSSSTSRPCGELPGVYVISYLKSKPRRLQF